MPTSITANFFNPSVFYQAVSVPTAGTVVQSGMTKISGKITIANGAVYEQYRVQGIISTGGASGYFPFVCLISGSTNSFIIKDNTTVIAENQNLLGLYTSNLGNQALTSDYDTSPIDFAVTQVSINDDNVTTSFPDIHGYYALIQADAAITTDISCIIFVDFIIMVPEGDIITFAN
jgi:hypothetical protein